VVGNVISLQNLVPNGEYFLSIGIAGNDAVTVARSALTNITLKNAQELDAVSFGLTFIANSGAGSITMTLSGAVANPLMIVVSQIPISAV